MPERSKQGAVDIAWMIGCLVVPALVLLALIARAIWILVDHPDGADLLLRYVGGGALFGLALAALNLFSRHEELYRREVNRLTGERTPWQLVRTTITGPHGQFLGAALAGALVGLIVAALQI